VVTGRKKKKERKKRKKKILTVKQQSLLNADQELAGLAGFSNIS